MAGLDIDRWPGGFFYLAGQFGPVDLALHWPEGPVSVRSGHMGVRSALARRANQIETSPPSELFSGGWIVSQFISGE